MGCISDADNPLEAAHSGASNVATWMRMYIRLEKRSQCSMLVTVGRSFSP